MHNPQEYEQGASCNVQDVFWAMTFALCDLHVSVGGKQLLNGLTMTIQAGEIHALMGPNGAGKSTLANTVAGHPSYVVTHGSVTLQGKDLLVMKPDERARAGLFLAFQHPLEIEGISYETFLLHAYKARFGKNASIHEFEKALDAALRTLCLDKRFIERDLNHGFSGGEKKRAELLQLLVVKPCYAILDEIDSGLDIDSLRIVNAAINALREQGVGIILITHCMQIIEHIQLDAVHVLINSVIEQTGTSTLVTELESKGYGSITRKNPEQRTT